MNSIIRQFLDPLGLEIRRRESTVRHTLRGAFEHIKSLGFHPRFVIDVGVARGTMDVYESFPEAKHLLIEPLAENRPFLEAIAGKFRDVTYIVAAAARKSGEITINVHPDFDGSSIYLETEGAHVDGTPRIVPAVTLDEVCEERQLQGTCVIKVDVQGAELDVLEGARRLMQESAEYIVVESHLFQFFKGGPQFCDVIHFMKERGFALYDIVDPAYRPLDGAMSQVDLAFVKDSGAFRKNHVYATQEQREKQNESFVKTRRQ